MIGGKEQGVFFTSGGSESNYLAIQSITANARKESILSRHLWNTHRFEIIFTSLQKQGYTITEIPVDRMA